MDDRQKQFVRWLYFTRKYPWSSQKARMTFVGAKTFEAMSPPTADFHETYVPALTSSPLAAFLHRYRKHLVFIKTHYDKDGVAEIQSALGPRADPNRSYQRILADRILQSVHEFDTLPSKAADSGKKTVGADVEHIIPGQIDILVGGVSFDMVLEIDATNDDLLFDLVVNHLRQLPCVSQTNTVTARPTFELRELGPVPNTRNKRGLASHTKDLQRQLLAFLVQKPWATTEEQGSFVFHAETDFKRVLRESFTNKNELAIEGEMPLCRYDHLAGYQRYFISIVTRGSGNAELIEDELQASGFKCLDQIYPHRITYQHQIADVIRSRLLRATLNTDNGPQIQGLIGDIRILLGQEDADLLLTFDALDNRFVYEVVLNEIRTIPGVYHTYTAWCEK